MVSQAYNFNNARVRLADVRRAYGCSSFGDLYNGIGVMFSMTALAAFGEVYTLNIGQNKTNTMPAMKVINVAPMAHHGHRYFLKLS